MSKVGTGIEEEFDHARRCFICEVTSAVVGVSVMGSPELSQQQAAKTASDPREMLNDPKITHAEVGFKHGTDDIQAFLARPKSAGPHHAVVIPISDRFSIGDYHRVTAARVAREGYAALAINLFSRHPNIKRFEEAKQILVEQMPDSLILNDVMAGIDYLRRQPFVKKGKVGVIGFCNGGRHGLLLAAQQPDDVAGVVSFYGALTLPPEFKRERNPLDVVKQIKAPVLGHYATQDDSIPVALAQQFWESLRAQGAPAELHFYEASHGFDYYDFSPPYDPEDSSLAWQRTFSFFKRHLK
jgi:carboxymethylenebutenolidase